MAFISLLFIGIFLVLAVIGLVLLLVSLILFLINRRRNKKGMEKKRGYKIAGIICLVFGCINIAPLVSVFLYSVFGKKVADFNESIKVVSMPERAVYHYYPDKNEYIWDADEAESRNLCKGFEASLRNESSVITYKEREYIALYVDLYDEKKIKLSKPKAYLQGMDNCYVFEIRNKIGFDLLCLKGYDNIISGWEFYGQIYCREDQCEQFLHTCKTEADYVLQKYLEDGRDLQITGADFRLADLGITEEFLDTPDDGNGIVLCDYPDKEYFLYSYGMDGLFTIECTIIGLYEGKWYCYHNYSQGEILDAHLLPEQGQRYLNSLEKE